MSKKVADEGQREGNEGSGNSGEGSGKSTEEQLQEMREQIQKLTSTNERLLNESKSEKQKRRELETSTEAKEREAAERAGNFEKLYRDAQKEVATLKKQLTDGRKSTIKDRIRNAVAKHATDTVDLDDLMNQPKFSAMLESGFDEETMTLPEEIAKEYVAKVYEAKPWMRKSTDTPRVANGFGARGANKEGQGGLDQLTNEQLIAKAFGVK